MLVIRYFGSVNSLDLNTKPLVLEATATSSSYKSYKCFTKLNYEACFKLLENCLEYDIGAKNYGRRAFIRLSTGSFDDSPNVRFDGCNGKLFALMSSIKVDTFLWQYKTTTAAAAVFPSKNVCAERTAFTMARKN